MRAIPVPVVKCTHFIVDANFYVSLIVIIVGSASSLTEEHSFFEFNVALYGELANNLRCIMAYLTVTEIFAFIYCFITKQYQYFIFLGSFLLLIIGSLQFYGQINSVETDPNLDLCLLYAGLSHIAFGAKALQQKAALV